MDSNERRCISLFNQVVWSHQNFDFVPEAQSGRIRADDDSTLTIIQKSPATRSWNQKGIRELTDDRNHTREARRCRFQDGYNQNQMDKGRKIGLSIGLIFSTDN